LSEAFATALVDWTRHGVPGSPEAWLLTVARRKMIDAARQRKISSAISDHLLLLAEIEGEQDEVSIPDNRLSLMFACAHSAIDPAIHAPLILQTVLGFDAATIASAFLVSPTTMGQRLVRAKSKIKRAGIPFRVPEAEELPERLHAVLEAIYAAFSEGWSDSAGTEAHFGNLAEEAIWLGRLTASLLPDQPEALGLLSLMLYVHARRGARRDPAGEYVPLVEQDTTLWDSHLIDEAEALLVRASSRGVVGRYQLEAAVQSAHVIRRRTGRPDWKAIERLYDALADISDSPVIAINRAVALSETRGAIEALAELDVLLDDPRLAGYQPYWAARAELLTRTGDAAGAEDAYQRAIGLESDAAVRRFLIKQRLRLAAK
jgi:RNA polymerase sigma-70 factor (ECF subfamily)